MYVVVVLFFILCEQTYEQTYPGHADACVFLTQTADSGEAWLRYLVHMYVSYEYTAVHITGINEASNMRFLYRLLQQ